MLYMNWYSIARSGCIVENTVSIHDAIWSGFIRHRRPSYGSGSLGRVGSFALKI